MQRSAHTNDFLGYQSCFFQLMQQITNAPNEIQFITITKLLHVSAPGCLPQGILEQWSKSPLR